ncbi:PIG-L family deacetylase [bacterium]|nr:PIG-L family deacetylase [bacterium]
MKFSQSGSDAFLPGKGQLSETLSATTHLGVGAHADDLEILAFPGITACLNHPTQRFTGVVVTNGSGAPRAGSYAKISDTELIQIRREEQRQAAILGQYGAIIQLGFPSAEIRIHPCPKLVEDLLQILQATQPRVVYLHNPADRHETHLAVLLSCLDALRQLPAASRPKEVYGCEVWGDLDWAPSSRVVRLSCPAPDDFGPSLLRCFRSQVEGGKRYDLAAVGRRRAQATFADAYSPDPSQEVVLALDLLPLLGPNPPTLQAYVSGLIDEFRQQTVERIQKLGSAS